jgi:transposase
MPRYSPFDITLTATERQILEETARKYTSPYIDVVRAKIVLYAADGLSNKQIGERLDAPRQIVSKWRKRFFEQGLAGLEELPRRGRPGKFSPLRRSRRKGPRV